MSASDAHHLYPNGRVVITGFGTVTAAGLGTARLLETLRAGRACLATVT